MCSPWIVTIGITVLNSIRDIRKKEIFLLPTLMCLAAGVIYGIAAGEEPLLLMAASYLPGILLLMFSLLSGGQVGRGDALGVLMLGGWLKWESVFAAVCAGFLAAGITAAVLLIRKTNKKKELPFMPFLLAGEILTVVLL